MQHQPTVEKLAQAKTLSRENLTCLLAQAEARQRSGDMAACEATLKRGLS